MGTDGGASGRVPPAEEGDAASPFDYAGITRNDPNPIKRWLQRRRLVDALRLLPSGFTPSTIVDYGAGDGELSLRLAQQFPEAEVICFEPVPFMLLGAAARLKGTPRVRLASEEAELPRGRTDLVVCTEVFEHLPPAELGRALSTLEGLLRTDGLALVGVPVETGAPALLKGLFRLPRGGPGAADVLRAVAGKAQARRLASEIAPGRAYYYEHIGFDHRALERELGARLEILRRCGSPLRSVPPGLNSEVYFLARRRSPARKVVH